MSQAAAPWKKRIGFAATRWSLVQRAGKVGSPQAEEFCEVYWFPLYGTARTLGESPEDAADQVQILFSRIFAQGLLGRLQPSTKKGRLRYWLLILLRRQLWAARRAASAQKRGGPAPAVMNWKDAEPHWQALASPELPPDLLYRRALAASLLEKTIDALAAEYASQGKEALFDALLPALESDAFPETLAEAAQRLGTTHEALRMAASRLRERFGRLLRKKCAVCLNVPNGPALDREIRELFS